MWNSGVVSNKSTNVNIQILGIWNMHYVRIISKYLLTTNFFFVSDIPSPKDIPTFPIHTP